ncbi:N-acetylglucosaminyldiphosphoundecaprenol N-acetyl-beta-D-mannosaminyltransferase [Jannaschia faecimaris]|uniref:N-acetylglucosaminyldiphosphoundecaprenol N-acetyl-beta-D-mannosaminyltransferase n=1 Tax=Jannaschia faecimaris TaxID=1244108 RepID=A0A1H3JCD0_9RHOB|nr:WecB/TagA/CpsF family glycosyltransferase [Jannaschia faecimaris]SDY37229.1 N-acetylglucosaminyldiphosphoundecaprenol N-acetyl-beta-D-mannosaminyltransferase [Jannaschia faecimaris]
MSLIAAPTSDPEAIQLASAKSAPRETGSTNVLGVSVSALSLPAAVEMIGNAVATDRRGYVCVCGVHGVIECKRDPALRKIHNDAMAVTPDGMPLVWALHADGHDTAGRVYGPDLMHAVFADGCATGMRHFLYGTTPEALTRLQQSLKRLYPDALIAGSYAPPFRQLTPDEEAHVAQIINDACVDVVWVGLSTPKQERWMATMRDRLDPAVLIGVGAAFDFIGGNKRAAPAVLQGMGLEWAFRLLTEPRRLWRRYARIVPSYLFLRFLQKTGLRRFPIQSQEGKP